LEGQSFLSTLSHDEKRSHGVKSFIKTMPDHAESMSDQPENGLPNNIVHIRSNDRTVFASRV
jgi:hypothetical protein